MALAHPKLHRDLGISRSTLYYKRKKPDKDLIIRNKIERVLVEHPSYGHKRIAIHLKMNKKKIIRVMNLYGIKPYRRHRKPWKRPNLREYEAYPNLFQLPHLYE